jgi:hypothetical protein
LSKRAKALSRVQLVPAGNEKKKKLADRPLVRNKFNYYHMNVVA